MINKRENIFKIYKSENKNRGKKTKKHKRKFNYVFM